MSKLRKKLENLEEKCWNFLDDFKKCLKVQEWFF